MIARPECHPRIQINYLLSGSEFVAIPFPDGNPMQATFAPRLEMQLVSLFPVPVLKVENFRGA